MRGHIKKDCPYKDFQKLILRAGKLKIDIIEWKLSGGRLGFMPCGFVAESFYDPKRNQTYFWIVESLLGYIEGFSSLYHSNEYAILVRYDGLVTSKQLEGSEKFRSILEDLHLEAKERRAKERELSDVK